MKKTLEQAALLAVLLVLAGCAGNEPAEPKWEEHLYRTVVYNSGEDESDAKYLEIAQRSQKLLSLLEEKTGAFVMDAYNYQTVDDEGTPLYTMNTPEVPIEIAPAGMSIQVSREYWRKYFYFEKVEAENNYNEMAGREERLDITEDQLTVNIIFVKDGQRYFTYRSDCASADGSWITDPLVQIYTGNIHCNYAHSFLTQWTYIPSEAGSPERAYEEIAPYIWECGAQESLKEVRPLRN